MDLASRLEPLTGMSHGASGIAVALLELHAATGRSDFLEAARGAFAYEDSLFDPKLGNWPDLRATDDPGNDSEPTDLLPGSGATVRQGSPWRDCGPPRSTLSMRQHHLAMARAAISTTLQAIDEILPHRGHDASLCHGLAGLIETAALRRTSAR